mgnify:CR=1 FL=1
MNLDHSNAALFAALAAAQAEVENATKASVNPHFKSRYADLAEVLNTVRPVFTKHGISIIQGAESDGTLVSVVTTLAHKDGGYVSSKASCVPAKWDGQGVGSATTYLRRYGLAAMCGIAQEDDDGQSAAHNNKPAPKKEVPLTPRLSQFLDRIAACEDVESLRALYTEAGTLPDAERDLAQQACQTRKTKLK